MDETRRPSPCPQTGGGLIPDLGIEAARGSRRVLLGGIAAGAVAAPAPLDRLRHDASAKKKKKKPKGCGQPACFVRAWGSEGSGDGQFNGPRAVAIAPNGNLYVVDQGNNRIQYFSASGAYLGQWDGPTTPNSVAVAPNGDVLVCGYNTNVIQRFSATGAFKGKWGSEGDADGQFQDLRAIAVAPNSMVYTVEGQGRRVQRFEPDGTFISKWGQNGSEPGQFFWPHDIAVAPNGDVYVNDQYNLRIQHFSANGIFLGLWGGHGDADGQFREPNGIAVAPNGDVFVSDFTYPAGASRIQRFSADGDFLGVWGKPGTGEGEMLVPSGIAVAANGKDLYVADRGNNRIQQFTLPTATKKKRKRKKKKH